MGIARGGGEGIGLGGYVFPPVQVLSVHGRVGLHQGYTRTGTHSPSPTPSTPPPYRPRIPHGSTGFQGSMGWGWYRGHGGGSRTRPRGLCPYSIRVGGVDGGLALAVQHTVPLVPYLPTPHIPSPIPGNPHTPPPLVPYTPLGITRTSTREGAGDTRGYRVVFPRGG